MLYQGSGGAKDDENFFLAMVQPPKAVAPAAITAARVRVRGRHLRLDARLSARHREGADARAARQSLRPSDSFNVMLFSGSSRMLAHEPVPATQANIDRGAGDAAADRAAAAAPRSCRRCKRIARCQARRRLAHRRRRHRRLRVGRARGVPARAQAARPQATCSRSASASSVNRHLIEGIARAGQGEAFVVTKPAARGRAGRALRKHDRVAGADAA